MKLSDLIAGLGPLASRGDLGVEIADLAYDSRRVGPGTLFFCVRGERADGHEFGSAAVSDGAAALVVEEELGLPVPEIKVADARAAMAPVAARFWGEPTQQLRVVGITGTNGKTTTAFLVREILEAAGVQTGLLGTVKQVVGGAEEEVERTTPEAIELQATFRRMLEAGDEACAMEVSSHALTLHRADAIRFEVAVFTNLTQDHLDFHADMDEYFAAKGRLFAELAPRVSIVNVDDPYGRRLAERVEYLTYSAAGSAADFVARGVELGASGATFEVLEGGGAAAGAQSGSRAPVDAAMAGAEPPAGAAAGSRPAVPVRTRLPGHFNVANALAAYASARAFGVEPAQAAAGLAAAPAPPGRLEPVDEGQGFSVVVDYAHTPDSVENVLRAARGFTTGRLIAVFGAGGDRDRGKRPLMGRAGGELADLVVVTSDNPRSEDPAAIVEEVAAGARGLAAAVEVEVDRRAAIALALGRAGAGDTVVIAGKGHEQGQEFEGGRKVPFDDREVARAELRRLGEAA